MPYGELYIPPVRKPYNPTNGQFLKGNVPFNAGKKWSEWMSKRGQKRAAKGWVNIDKYRPKSRPDNSERCRKHVIAVFDDGTWMYFSHPEAAAIWVSGNSNNLRRCCRSNEEKKVCKHDWRPGQAKGASRINTDHKYKGIRFYFETDNVWTTKIKEL